MDRLLKGTKIRLLLKSDWIKHIYKEVSDGRNIDINGLDDVMQDMDDIKAIRTVIEYPPINAVLKEDLPILNDYSGIDVRLTYEYRGHNCTSAKILNIFMYDDNCFQVEAEDGNYYFRVFPKE